MTSIVEVKDLTKHYPIRRGILRRTVGHVKAVDGISFSLNKGETLGLVGESGCGKTTAGRCLMRILEATAGSVLFGDAGTDILTLNRKQMRPFRARMQMIFQDPNSSLNPRMTVGDIVGEPLKVNRLCSGSELEERVSALIRSVGLRSADARRYPHAFSGGQRQRIGIARALSLHPDLIVADEAVSALDVSVQAQILNLLAELRETFGLTYIFIAHDLSVVKHISDRVAVMYLGRIVEMSMTSSLFSNPMHPYTEALISAVPVADPNIHSRRTRIRLAGDVPNPVNPPSGCHFHPRCNYATDVCRTEVPSLRKQGFGLVACHRSEELDLSGV
ncbi:MAG: dipeptide ABC transporter ATP-binding protein [Candidatus Latescibacteria bacterium]|nr:dipeptide ABC transporter ATP-binding protein [Candidatus Latescibacterota bacterium]